MNEQPGKSIDEAISPLPKYSPPRLIHLSARDGVASSAGPTVDFIQLSGS